MIQTEKGQFDILPALPALPRTDAESLTQEEAFRRRESADPSSADACLFG